MIFIDVSLKDVALRPSSTQIQKRKVSYYRTVVRTTSPHTNLMTNLNLATRLSCDEFNRRSLFTGKNCMTLRVQA
jgi:hypothetical protein